MIHRTEGKVHWTIWLFALIGIAFVVMASVQLMKEARKPPYERVGEQFVRALARKQYDAAQKLVDTSALSKERKDFKKLWEDRMAVWGEIDGVELIDAVPAPSDLKHPKASEGYRLEYHLKGYLTVGTAFVYVVPQNGEWKIVDYEFR